MSIICASLESFMSRRSCKFSKLQIFRHCAIQYDRNLKRCTAHTMYNYKIKTVNAYAMPAYRLVCIGQNKAYEINYMYALTATYDASIA